MGKGGTAREEQGKERMRKEMKDGPGRTVKGRKWRGVQATAKVVCSTRTSVPVSQGSGGQVGVARQCARLFGGGHGLRVLGGNCRWSSEGSRSRRRKDAQYHERKNNGGLCRNFHGKRNLGRPGVTEAGMAAVGSSPEGRRKACMRCWYRGPHRRTAGARTQ